LQSSIPCERKNRKAKKQQMKNKIDRRTIRDAIRGSVPDGKLRKTKIILKDDISREAVGGFVKWSEERNAKVEQLGAPSGMTADHIAIRDHETRHATYHGKRSPKKKMTAQENLVANFIDDVHDESVNMPVGCNGASLIRYARKHLALAVKTLRHMERDKKQMMRDPRINTPMARNAMMLHSLRLMQMLATYGAMSYCGLKWPKTGNASKLRIRLRSMLGGARQYCALDDIMHLAQRRRNRTKAIDMALQLLEPEYDPDDIDYSELDIPPMNGEMLGHVAHGSAEAGTMEIRYLLPHDTVCSREKVKTRKLAPDGVLINPARYVAAIVNNDSAGLFARQLKRKLGGTVVIDASGSMSPTAVALRKVCEKIPTSTVAYYSGQGNATGTLSVYAAKGRRYSSDLPENTLYGGNDVDLPALRWLMKHPKPWTLVSDLEFCGGIRGSEVIAHAIVEREVKAGNLKVYRSLDAAYHAFGGKGDLDRE
jgi:hypothetical protein